MAKSKKKSFDMDIRSYLRLRKIDKDITVIEKPKVNVKKKQKNTDYDVDDHVLKRRERNRLQMRRLRASRKYRKLENERNKVYRQKKRESEDYVLKMREQQKLYMRKLRADEDYRNFERHRDKLYKRRKRKDIDYLEKIRAKDREYRRKVRAKLKMIDTDSDDSLNIKDEIILDKVNKRKRGRPKKIVTRVKSMSPKTPTPEPGFTEVDFDMFVLENMEFIKEPIETSDDDEK